MKIGFIGLGNMGGAVARNIQRAGFDLVVHDLRKEAATKLMAQGAKWAATPADMIDQVDIVVTMVFGPKEIEQVVRGAQGLLAGNCQGKGWIDSTTSSPVLMRMLATEFEQAGASSRAGCGSPRAHVELVLPGSYRARHGRRRFDGGGIRAGVRIPL